MVPPTTDPGNPAGETNQGDPEKLPVTGAMTAALVGFAGLLLLAGGGLMFARKRLVGTFIG